MCIICPPLLPPVWKYHETRARLTPFWIARRKVDEIIERDRRLTRTSSGSEKKQQRTGFSVEFSNGFYYVWFDRFSEFSSCVSNCFPLTIAMPDYIVQKCKLRRDQIEYMELKRRRIHV